jgi:hypothetical protein
MSDEDWPIFGRTIPYSETISDPVNGELAYYATIDIVLRACAPALKLGIGGE